METIYKMAVDLIPEDQGSLYKFIGYPLNVFILNKFLIERLNPKVKNPIRATNIATGEVIVITNGNLALKEYGFIPQNVYNVLNGKQNKHKGYFFERLP